MFPKGNLIPIGGAEDKEGEKNILKKVIEATGKKKPVFEIITTATSHPKRTATEYSKAFTSLGARSNDMCISRYKQGNHRNVIGRLEKCDGVFFTGGDQLRLTTFLGGTYVPGLLKERYYNEKKFVIAGTSAGDHKFFFVIIPFL